MRTIWIWREWSYLCWCVICKWKTNNILFGQLKNSSSDTLAIPCIQHTRRVFTHRSNSNSESIKYAEWMNLLIHLTTKLNAVRGASVREERKKKKNRLSRRRQNVLTSPKIAIAFGPSRTFILNQFSRAEKLYIAARSVFPFCDNFCFRSDSLRLFMYIDVWRRTWTRNDTIWAFATPEWRRRRRRRNNIVSEAVKCYVFSSLCRRCVVAFGLIDDFIISAWKWRSGWSWITYTYCDLSSIQRKCNYGANEKIKYWRQFYYVTQDGVCVRVYGSCISFERHEMITANVKQCMVAINFDYGKRFMLPFSVNIRRDCRKQKHTHIRLRPNAHTHSYLRSFLVAPNQKG